MRCGPERVPVSDGLVPNERRKWDMGEGRMGEGRMGPGARGPGAGARGRAPEPSGAEAAGEAGHTLRLQLQRAQFAVAADGDDGAHERLRVGMRHGGDVGGGLLGE